MPGGFRVFTGQRREKRAKALTVLQLTCLWLVSIGRTFFERGKLLFNYVNVCAGPFVQCEIIRNRSPEFAKSDFMSALSLSCRRWYYNQLHRFAAPVLRNSISLLATPVAIVAKFSHRGSSHILQFLIRHGWSNSLTRYVESLTFFSR